ncbi:hypothetical protein DFS34DRAFT_686424 [Phlyctochytrium arcticum]|nr:hypothetical protein DFS34DRAFT_686424 [Phlyctochytrium arcticum]
MSIATSLQGSTFPVVPNSWIYQSKNFGLTSNALSENIVTWKPIKYKYDYRAPGSVIKIDVNSSTSFLRPQRSYFTFKVKHFNADGSINTTVDSSLVGLMSHLKSQVIRMSGKTVEDIVDLPEFLAESYTYETSSRVGNKDILKNSDGSFTVKHHVRSGIFDNVNGSPIPLCLLPTHTMELNWSLNAASAAVANAPAGGYFTIEDPRLVGQIVTPDAAFLSHAWEGLEKGRVLQMDYVAPTIVYNNCNGSTLNTFNLPVANSRIVGLMARFRDDNVYSTSTGDKSVISTPQNMTSWRIKCDQYNLPNGEEFKVEDTLMVGALSMSDSETYESEDIDLDSFLTKNFTIRFSWQSSDEDQYSALNLQGTSSSLQLITKHSSPPPSTQVALVTTVFTHRTLLIGNTVDVQCKFARAGFAPHIFIIVNFE